jgi:hypothetical protein
MYIKRRSGGSDVKVEREFEAEREACETKRELCEAERE